MKDLDKVLIVGASGHAKVVIDLIEQENKHQILGIVDSFKPIGTNVLGYSVIGKIKDVPQIVASENCGLFIAIGDNYTRYKIFEYINGLSPNVNFISIVHPFAQIAKAVSIGNGVAVMAGAIINSNSSIDDFAIVNTKASIDHDCKIGKFSSIAPGVTMGGNVSVGKFSAISLGANVIHNINIGTNTLIAASATVVNSIGDNVLALGIPAKEVRKRTFGEKYL